MSYRDLAFSSPGEEKKFGRWLLDRGLHPLIREHEGHIPWPMLLDIHRAEMERRKEGWYASFEDVFGGFMLALEGKEPAARPPAEERMREAREIFRANTRHGVSKIMLLAREEHPEALTEAGRFFYEGIHVSRREDLALARAERACGLGWEGGLALLGMFRALGVGRRKDPEEAARLLRRAEACGHPGNAAELGFCLAAGIGADQDAERGAAILWNALEAGNTRAGILLHVLILREALPPTPDGVIPPLVMAVEMGDPDACAMDGRERLDIATDPAYAEAADEAAEQFALAARLLASAAEREHPHAIGILRENPEFRLNDGSVRRLTDMLEDLPEDGPEA